MNKVRVELNERSYPIHIGPGLFDRPELLQEELGTGRAVVITNTVVAPLYLERVKKLLGENYAEEIVLPDGEEHKTLATVAGIYDRLLAGKFDRKTILVALGGGVVGDITGFAAATYQRGIEFIQLPTTLLAQVDSSVGGKTGVNHQLGKNMIGAFYQPRCVLADIEVLSTLPEREVKAGLAEVLKYGLITDTEFFTWLERHAAAIGKLDTALVSEAVQRCCEIKAAIVARDERESGSRALLNLGHTFGHAIETAAGYGVWLHGETVAMGIVMAADLSHRLGWLSSVEAMRIRRILEQNYAMPVLPPVDISVERYLDLMASDKKAESGRIRFILLKAIGEAVISSDVPTDVLAQTLTAGKGLCN